MQILRGLLDRRIHLSSIVDRSKRLTAGEWIMILQFHSHDLTGDLVYATVLSSVIGQVILILILERATGQVITAGQVTTQDQVTIPGQVTFAGQVTTQGQVTFAGQVTILGQATFAGRVTTRGQAIVQDGAPQMMIMFRGNLRAQCYFHQCPMVDLHLRMVDIECQDIQDIA